MYNSYSLSVAKLIELTRELHFVLKHKQSYKTENFYNARTGSKLTALVHNHGTDSATRLLCAHTRCFTTALRQVLVGTYSQVLFAKNCRLIVVKVYILYACLCIPILSVTQKYWKFTRAARNETSWRAVLHSAKSTWMYFLAPTEHGCE